MSPINVAKFGGTSVANAAAMNHCADIVLANPATRVVVLSASAGVTNLLVALAQGELDEAGRDEHLAKLAGIQQAILADLGNPVDVSTLIHGQLDEIRLMAQQAHQHTDAELADRLIACGELMSTRLFTELLRQRGVKAHWQDVRQLMRTDSRFGKATVDLATTRTLCQQTLGPQLGDSLIITQGFIGADGDGRTTTLGRGGSDYSAALLAEALDAASIEIWTDVPGIYTTDPRLVTRARPIPEISFVEAAEMATFGAKVLHPATLQPAVRQNIPVFVGSAKDPAAGGTWHRFKPAVSRRRPAPPAGAGDPAQPQHVPRLRLSGRSVRHSGPSPHLGRPHHYLGSERVTDPGSHRQPEQRRADPERQGTGRAGPALQGGGGNRSGTGGAHRQPDERSERGGQSGL